MGFNPRANPHTQKAQFASVATNASSNLPVVCPAGAGQILGARFVNGATSSVASGTTAGSAVNVYVYKTASSTDSQVASARLGQVATLATATLTMSTSSALTQFSNGDVYLAEFVGGAGNNRDNAGCFIQVSFMYAHTRTDTATP